jgi:hypothetical protein
LIIFCFGCSDSPCCEPVAKKAQSKSLEDAQGTSPYAADWPCCGGARPSLLSALPQSTWPRLPDGRGPLVLRRRPCSRHWIKSKNPAAPAVTREAEEDWGKREMAALRPSAGQRSASIQR